MNRLERELRESLNHRDPPARFAEKVIARAYATESPYRNWLSRQSWQRLAAAAVIVLMAGGGFFYQQEQRRLAENERTAEIERTKEQLMVGLNITSSKLRRVHDRLEAIQQRAMDLHLEE